MRLGRTGSGDRADGEEGGGNRGGLQSARDAGRGHYRLCAGTGQERAPEPPGPRRWTAIPRRGTRQSQVHVAALVYAAGSAFHPRKAGRQSPLQPPQGFTMTEPLPHRVACCIAGGGPAGMMLGFLLARAGVEVVVLEKHGDFLRDFRGDTIHPSTLEVMHELGLLDDFLQRPHQEVPRARAARSATTRSRSPTSRHLPTRCRFIALMPQWDFLDFLAERGRALSRRSTCGCEAEVTDLIEEGGRVVGVRGDDARRAARGAGRSGGRRRRPAFDGARARRPRGRRSRRADRRAVDAAVDAAGRPGADRSGRFDGGTILVMLDRGDYWQCAFVIPQGRRSTALRATGLDGVPRRHRRLAPFLRDRVDELRDWDDVKLLTVAVDRLRQWYRPGPAVHRRRGARDVAGRRRRHQPGDPGRGRRGEHPRRAAARRAR